MLPALSDKFMPAALPEACAPRRALMERFMAAEKDRFLYISAVGGSGKTVSTLLWLSLCGRKPVWIGLDEYDNAPSVFYRQLAAGICATQPDNANMGRIYADAAFSSSPVEHTIALVSELAPDEGLYALVLDDFHHIANAEIIKSLAAILRRLPMTFTVTILSRREMPKGFEALFRGAGTGITEDDLRFSESEMRQFMDKAGVFLSQEEYAFARMLTDGLAIGVAAIAKSDGTGFGRYEDGFKGYMMDYLWERWDGELRGFMLETSVVDEMTEKLASVLHGGARADGLLGRLLEEVPFVSRTGHGAYRYHHIFLAFLREIAQGSGMDMGALNKAAAGYYLEAGEYMAARRYAIRSGDDEAILKTVYLFQQYTNPSLDEYVAFSQTFNQDALPEEICERHPYLYSPHLYLAFLLGKAKEAEYYWDKLRGHIGVITEKYPQMLEVLILELSLDYRTPFAQQIEGFAALPRITHKSERQQGASVTMQMPFLHRSIRDYHELADPGVMDRLGTAFGMLLKEHYELARCCLASGLLLEKNQVGDALECALRAKGLAHGIQSPEFKFAAYMHLAAARHAAGEQALLDDALQEAEAWIDAANAGYLNHNFLAYKARLALYGGDKGAAREWLDRYFTAELHPGSGIPLYRMFQYFTTARAYMVLNQPDKAMGIVEGLIRLASDFRRPLDLAEARTLKACLEWALGDKQGAVATLEAALLDMSAHGFVRVVSDEGAAIAPVLKRVAARAGRGGADARPWGAYVTEVQLAAHEASKRHKGVTAHIAASRKPVKLSKQQKKMLEFLAQGYRNPMIAKMTGLALPTVKGHLSLAYGKLGVNNAMDAVLKARELKLID